MRYYRSGSDSPYFAQLQSGEAYLNDFEGNDGYWWLNQAGQTVFTECETSQRDGLSSISHDPYRGSAVTFPGPGKASPLNFRGSDH